MNKTEASKSAARWFLADSDCQNEGSDQRYVWNDAHCVAEVFDDSARLIAAAPELLEALKTMVNFGNLGAYERAAAMKAARAAISAATGSAQ